MHVMKKTFSIIGALAVVAAFASPVLALAQGQGIEVPQKTVGNFGDVINILERLLSWIYTLFFIIAAIMIVWAGFSYLTAGGDEEKVSKAHRQFIYAIVAIAVAIVAVSVRFVVQNLIGA